VGSPVTVRRGSTQAAKQSLAPVDEVLLGMLGVAASPADWRAREKLPEVREHEMTGEGALELRAVDVEEVALGDDGALRLALDCGARDGIALGRGGT